MNKVGGPKRRFRITVRLSSEESKKLRSAANEAGVSLSAFARCALVGTHPLPSARRPTVEAAVLARILGRLGCIASDLTSIANAARQPNNHGELTPFLERDLLRVLSGLKPCRALLLKALGARRPAS